MTITQVGAGVAKLGDQLERRIGVVVIVVAERLALDLLGLADAAARAGRRGVEGGLLVRILAVAQRLAALEARAAASPGSVSPWSAKANQLAIIAS